MVLFFSVFIYFLIGFCVFKASAFNDNPDGKRKWKTIGKKRKTREK